MKLGEKIIVESGRRSFREAQDQNPEDQNLKNFRGSLVAQIKESSLVSDMTKFFLALVIASGTYFVASIIISEDMNYFLRHFLCLVFSIMTLAAFNLVQTTVPIIGRAIIVLLFLFFIYKTTDHYFGQPQKNRTAGEVKEQIIKSTVSDILVLYPGIYSFELEDSASSGWLTIPRSGRYRYTISSPSYSYKIVLLDGRVYSGDPKTIIPWNQRPVFKLVRQMKSQKETISVEITEI